MIGNGIYWTEFIDGYNLIGLVHFRQFDYTIYKNI